MVAPLVQLIIGQSLVVLVELVVRLVIAVEALVAVVVLQPQVMAVMAFQVEVVVEITALEQQVEMVEAE